MALVSLKCPSCGGNIQMDDAKEKGFCMYCGSNFLVKDEVQRMQIEHSGSIELSRKTEAENLLIRAEQKIKEFKNDGRNIDSYCKKIIDDYIEKALDINPKSQEAHALKNRLLTEQKEESNRLFQKQREEYNLMLNAERAAAEFKDEKERRDNRHVLIVVGCLIGGFILLITILLNI